MRHARALLVAELGSVVSRIPPSPYGGLASLGAGLRAVTGGRIYTTTHETISLPSHESVDGGVLRAFSADTGALLWTTSYFGRNPQQGLGHGDLFSVAIAGDTVFVTGRVDPDVPGDPAISTLDVYSNAGCTSGPGTCRSWSAPLAAPATGPLTVGGGVVYAAVPNGADSTILAYDADGCRGPTCTAPLATIPLISPPAQVSLAQGALLVGGAGLTAYRPPT